MNLEEARRASKRQAAPFSRGEPKSAPRRPGRRSGEEHGRHGHREPPGEVDEELDAPLAPRCECGGEIVEDRIEYQYQDELPEPRPVRRRFAVHIGKCVCCGRRHQGRHPFQTSDALGAAACMLGPRAVALATELNKELGLSPQKTAKALARFGIQVTAGGVVQAIARQSRALEPTYRALVEGVRASAAVAPDETGWRINGQKAWLWAFAGEGVTVYLIAPGRGYEHAAEVLGEDYSGVLERDGWAPYRRFTNASHQTCHAHLLRRTGELIADSVAGQARVPHAVRRILKDALALRDQRDQDTIDADEFGLKVRDLNERTDKVLQMHPTHEPNRRLLAHLATEREHLFTFLTESRCAGDQLARRAGAQTGDREPQELGREPHRAGRAHPADHDERDPHRPPAEHRPARTDGERATRPPAGRQRTDQAPRPCVPDHPRGLTGDARADPDPRNPLPDRLLRA